jgi:hypothetical protein
LLPPLSSPFFAASTLRPLPCQLFPRPLPIVDSPCRLSLRPFPSLPVPVNPLPPAPSLPAVQPRPSHTRPILRRVPPPPLPFPCLPHRGGSACSLGGTRGMREYVWCHWRGCVNFPLQPGGSWAECDAIGA